MSDWGGDIADADIYGLEGWPGSMPWTIEAGGLIDPMELTASPTAPPGMFDTMTNISTMGADSIGAISGGSAGYGYPNNVQDATPTGYPANPSTSTMATSNPLVAPSTSAVHSQPARFHASASTCWAGVHGRDGPRCESGFFADPTETAAIPAAAFVPPAPRVKHGRHGQSSSSKEQEQMLISLRQAGVGFEDIAEEMYAKLGVKISPNVLVKRYQKTLDSFLLPVAEATKSAMPDVMAVIMRELGKQKGTGELSEEERTALEGLRHDMPRIVQNRVLRKKKAMLRGEE